MPGGKVNALSFDQLREANKVRAAKWNNGNPTELDFDMMELAGEVGEACNAAKKIARLRRGMPGGSDERANLADELADVVICADLAADKVGINLSDAIVRKFNATSEKHGFSDRLPLARQSKQKEPSHE